MRKEFRWTWVDWSYCTEHSWIFFKWNFGFSTIKCSGFRLLGFEFNWITWDRPELKKV